MKKEKSHAKQMKDENIVTKSGPLNRGRSRVAAPIEYLVGILGPVLDMFE